MYGNYYPTLNSQSNLDRINTQINELERIKSQITNPTTNQPTNLTQNFSFTPTNSIGIKYANTIDDVAREPIFVDTPFFSKDMSVMWLKNPKNEIKTYELTEIIPKDEKDLMIENLKMQLDEMNKTIKEMKDSAKPIVTNVDATITSEESPSVSVSRTSKKK